MAASIENVSLLITNSLGLQNALQGLIGNGFTLTSYTDGTGVPTLSSGRADEINFALYRIKDGDLAVDITGIGTDGVKFIYIEDNGTTRTAKALPTVPTWRGDLGGWFLSGASTSKAFFRFVKAGTSYTNRSNLIQTVAYVPSDISVTNIIASGNMTGGTVVTNVITERTAAAGVTIDGALIKDGSINNALDCTALKNNGRITYTFSTGVPTGGSDGDVHYQYT